MIAIVSFKGITDFKHIVCNCGCTLSFTQDDVTKFRIPNYSLSAKTRKSWLQRYRLNCPNCQQIVHVSEELYNG